MTTCTITDWSELLAADPRTAARAAALAAIQRATVMGERRPAWQLRRRAMRLLEASSDPHCPLLVTAAACAALAGT